MITSTWNHLSGYAWLRHDSRFPLHLPGPSADFDFQGNGVAYHAFVAAGSKASRADLEALGRMVASISFPPAGAPRASAGRSPHAS